MFYLLNEMIIYEEIIPIEQILDSRFCKQEIEDNSRQQFRGLSGQWTHLIPCCVKLLFELCLFGRHFELETPGISKLFGLFFV